MDATLPALMAAEVPAGDVYDRWDGGDIDDEALLHEAARNDYDVVLFYGRRYLLQPHLRELAKDLGLRLAAVHAPNPAVARHRITQNAKRLRSVLRDTPYALILSASVEDLQHDAKPGEAALVVTQSDE